MNSIKTNEPQKANNPLQSNDISFDAADEERNIQSHQIQRGDTFQQTIKIDIPDESQDEETPSTSITKDVSSVLHIENNQSQQTRTTKKTMCGVMVATPFIAIGIYAAVALSAGIVEFNPLVAAGIFFGTVVAAAACFALIKISEKVSREKDKDPSIGTLTALENVLTPKCLEGNKIEVLSSCY